MPYRTELPRTADLPMTDGLAALVCAVLALPAVPGESFAGLAELVSFPSRVLEMVADEIREAQARREVRVRPSCAEVRTMVLAAMRARHALRVLRDARR
jgi:hypothetical protein